MMISNNGSNDAKKAAARLGRGDDTVGDPRRAQIYQFELFEPTANLRTNIMDFRGFDSSIILILRVGILMSIGDFLESLSQAILVGVMLGGLGGVSSYLSIRRCSPCYNIMIVIVIVIVMVMSNSNSNE